MVRRISHTALRGLLPFVVLLAAAACNLRRGPLEGRASDEWTRTYTLDEGGEIQIVGGTGSALRIDTVATALHAEMTVDQLVDLDLAYAPPFSPVWDPIQVAARALIPKA